MIKRENPVARPRDGRMDNSMIIEYIRSDVDHQARTLRFHETTTKLRGNTKPSPGDSLAPRLHVKKIIHTFRSNFLYARWQKAIVFMKFIAEDETRGLLLILSSNLSFVLAEFKSNGTVEWIVRGRGV